jgi:hypothetical protein
MRWEPQPVASTLANVAGPAEHLQRAVGSATEGGGDDVVGGQGAATCDSVRRYGVAGADQAMCCHPCVHRGAATLALGP